MPCTLPIILHVYNIIVNGIIRVIIILLFIHIHPQVSELCPGEYPTTIDILITNSTDDVVEQFNDVLLKVESPNHILTSVVTIILKLDVSYTAQMTFSNLNGKFNITVFESSSKLTFGIIH